MSKASNLEAIRPAAAETVQRVAGELSAEHAQNIEESERHARMVETTKIPISLDEAAEMARPARPGMIVDEDPFGVGDDEPGERRYEPFED